MKKFLSVITFVILLLTFAGCGAADDNADNGEKKKQNRLPQKKSRI